LKAESPLRQPPRRREPVSPRPIGGEVRHLDHVFGKAGVTVDNGIDGDERAAPPA